MRIIFALLLAGASFLLPVKAFAESADVEGIIEGVDEDHQTVTLSDGKKYQAPDAFDFEGLRKGVKVVVFYTDTSGKRVINDLQILE
jgi:hypothetical protein